MHKFQPGDEVEVVMKGKIERVVITQYRREYMVWDKNRKSICSVSEEFLHPLPSQEELK